MNMQIQPKQLVTLGLALMLAIGSYWIPLTPGVLMPNPNSPEQLTHSTPVESGIFVHEPAKVWQFQ